MKAVIILICGVIGAIMLAVFIHAWINDVKMELFRANVKPGQMVTYFRMYYSRTEQDSEYGKGIICQIEEDNVVVIKSDMSKITLRRRDLYPV